MSKVSLVNIIISDNNTTQVATILAALSFTGSGKLNKFEKKFM